MRKLLIALVLFGTFSSCSDSLEGLLGEWEGKTTRVGNSGNPVESEVSCTISSASESNRNVELTVAGSKYVFSAIEDTDELLFKDVPLGKDSSVMSYITGSAELRFDTILHFEHEVYTLKNGAFTNSEKFEFDLTRKE